jgi:hypothetical protein
MRKTIFLHIECVKFSVEKEKSVEKSVGVFLVFHIVICDFPDSSLLNIFLCDNERLSLLKYYGGSKPPPYEMLVAITNCVTGTNRRAGVYSCR